MKERGKGRDTHVNVQNNNLREMKIMCTKSMKYVIFTPTHSQLLPDTQGNYFLQFRHISAATKLVYFILLSPLSLSHSLSF